MSEAETFEVTTVSHDAGRRVVRVRGEVDPATCPQLESALAETPEGESVVLDLTDCTFVDSSGLRVVLAAARETTAVGGAFALVATNPGVLRVLEIANVEARVPIHSTIEQATVEIAG